MSGEISVDGVFLPVLLVAAFAAALMALPIRVLLAESGFYRLVWHRGLFDIALLVLIWTALAFALLPA